MYQVPTSGNDRSVPPCGVGVCYLMPYRTDIQVRFADTDALGHVNNSAFAHYAEHARIEFFQHLAGRGRNRFFERRGREGEQRPGDGKFVPSAGFAA